MTHMLSRLAATIANGQSLSGAIAVDNHSPTVLEMPTSWTAAVISFQGSGDGTNYFNLYKEDGTEITLTADATRRYILTSSNFTDHKYIKIRSGTAATPVNQGGDRVLYIELWE